MPSLTVVFSSDTDICFSPGLYGDCLPTGCNRRGRGFIPGRVRVFPFHARTSPSEPAPIRPARIRHIDTMDIVKLT
ncbi:hypothetical protein EAO71_11805 [Streptomyces sp. ms191]|nr:hypothetical protein EAO71_11805 [Streptomyces sp. ms191]